MYGSNAEECSKCQIKINQAALLQEKTGIRCVQYMLDQHFVLCLEADLRHSTLHLNAIGGSFFAKCHISQHL